MENTIKGSSRNQRQCSKSAQAAVLFPMNGEPVFSDFVHFPELSFKSLDDSPKLAAVRFRHMFIVIGLIRRRSGFFVALSFGFLTGFFFRFFHLSLYMGLPVALFLFLDRLLDDLFLFFFKDICICFGAFIDSF